MFQGTKNKSISSNRKYRLEKLNLPKFNGNVRNFPRFIKDFNQLALVEKRTHIHSDNVYHPKF